MKTSIYLQLSFLLSLAASPFANAELNSNSAAPALSPLHVTSPEQVPQGLAESDWQSIRAAYEAERHAFQQVKGGWQALNPGQRWITRFDNRGCLTTPQDGGWTWGLELRSYGFGDEKRIITGTPAVTADGQRLSYRWDDTVEEWFVNDRRGLEHGFTVANRPAVPEDVGAASETLTFLLATRGNLRTCITSDGLGVIYQDASGTAVLNYLGLKVTDSAGQPLASRFEAADGNAVRLLVEEKDARYPITIDPIAQQAYLKASNTTSDDQFGRSVAVSGDTVVVGALAESSSATGVNGNQSDGSASQAGAAYVFVRSGTTWSQQAYLKASNTGAYDNFGRSVAVAGDTVVVGAYSESSSTTGVNGDQTDNSAEYAGAAYVFVRSGTVWSQQAYLKASNTEAYDRFGRSVAVAGDTVVVGADYEDSSATGVNGNQADNSATHAGAAYVFVRSGTNWSQQAYLKASNAGADDDFGTAVAISGDTVVVGAYGEDSSATGINGSQTDNSASGSGAAYVFVRNVTTWSQQAYLKASNTGAGDLFGYSVALAGDTVVVGASAESSNAIGVNGDQADNSASGAGAAYVFVRSGTAWSPQAYLKGDNSRAEAFFGVSVAVAGDTVVVGADGSESASGFVRSGMTWSQQALIKTSNADAYGDSFGYSVAVAGDTVVVGAPYEDSSATGVNGNQTDNLASGSGAAYVFIRSGASWIQQAYLKASNTGAGDSFGGSVAISGDTVVVGAREEDSIATGVNGDQADDSTSGAGAAYVFVRSGSTWSQQAYLKAFNVPQGWEEGDGFGYSVAISGDTVVVGAPWWGRVGEGWWGAAYVFVRSGTVWSQQAHLEASNADGGWIGETDDTYGDYFGYSVAISGNTVVVGAPAESSSAKGVNGDQTDNSAEWAGAAYVFVRSGTVWSQQAYLKASNTGLDDFFGESVAISGDTVVVGAPWEDSAYWDESDDNQSDNSAYDSGAAYVFVRSGTTWSQQAFLKGGILNYDTIFGYSVAVAGDTVVVGAPREDESFGAAYVFVRSGTTWTEQASRSGLDEADRFGASVAVSGDTVVVGADGEDSSATDVNGDQADNSASGAGAAYVFGIVAAPEIVVEQPAGSGLTDGGGVYLVTAVTDSAVPATFTIRNTGTVDLTGLAVTCDGPQASDFSIGALGATTLTPAASTTFTVTFIPGAAGTRTAAIHIASNDADENPFDITLTGRALSPNDDTDDDGLNDLAEFKLAILGFDWQVAQASLVNSLFANANSAGLFTTAQVHALHQATPLISRDPASGRFTLKMNWKKSTDLQNFTDFPAQPSEVTVDSFGDILFEFTGPEAAAFFLLETQ